MPWDEHDKGVRESSRVDLRRWILTDHASTQTRFEQAIAAHVPIERWKERPGGDGASIAWLLFHLSYHQDLAVSCVVLGRPPLLADHRDRLGLAGTARHDGLGEAEQPEVTAALDLDGLTHYAATVHRATNEHLSRADLEQLDDEVLLEGLADLSGVRQQDVPWLYAMWTGKSAAWMVQWEAVGHVHGHVAEMISVRGRLGLSPF
jgi:hypothetical protein